MVFFKNYLQCFGGIALAALVIFDSQMLEAAWTTPVVISDSNSDQPNIAVDLSGNAVAVWQGFDGNNYVIQSSKLPYSGNWSQITTLSSAGQDAQGCRVAIDSSGNAVSSWSRFDGNYSIIQSASLPYNSSWSQSVNVSLSGANAEAPELAMDYIGSIGNAVLVWHRYNGSNFIVQGSQLESGGSWSTPDNLSASGQDAFIPEVAVDSNGNAITVFSRYNSSEFTSCIVSLLHGQNWGSSATLSNPSQPSNGPQVALDPSGNSVAVWSEFNGTNYVIKTSNLPYGSSWSTEQSLSDDSQNAFAPTVSLDGNGNAVVAWLRFDGSNYIVQASVASFGGSWSTPVNLSSSGEDANNVMVKMNPAGQALVVWDQTSATDSCVYSASYSVGGTWGSTESVSSTGNFARFPSVGLDSSGNAVAVWLQFDGTKDVVYGSSS